MSAWAPCEKDGTVGSAWAVAGGRRPSLGGGMPAWAPVPYAPAEQRVAVEESHASGKKSSSETEVADASLVLPDWIAAASGGISKNVRDLRQ